MVEFISINLHPRKMSSMLLQNNYLRCLHFMVFCLILSGCRTSVQGEPPTNNLYCDNFLIYELCALDSNRDGIVEFVYFNDSKELFMYRDQLPRRLPTGITMHRCAMPMDESLVGTTSRVFYIDESTTLLEKTDIRGAMMIKYIAQLPEVTACNMRAEQELEKRST